MLGGVFLGLHVKCQPFQEDTDDNLQSASLLSTVLTLLGAVQLMAATAHDDPFKVMLFMMVVNIVVVFMAIYTAVMDTIPSIVEKYRGHYDDLKAAAGEIKARAEDGIVAQGTQPANPERAHVSVPRAANTISANIKNEQLSAPDFDQDKSNSLGP